VPRDGRATPWRLGVYVNSEGLWVALAATLAFLGAVWQTVLGARIHIDSMKSFLGAHNQVVMDEKARIRDQVPRWSIFRRRREMRAVGKRASVLLSPAELKLAKLYNQQTYGWSFVLVAAGVFMVVGWMDFFRP
jgi:hypothetical protein